MERATEKHLISINKLRSTLLLPRFLAYLLSHSYHAVCAPLGARSEQDAAPCCMTLLACCPEIRTPAPCHWQQPAWASGIGQSTAHCCCQPQCRCCNSHHRDAGGQHEPKAILQAQNLACSPSLPYLPALAGQEPQQKRQRLVVTARLLLLLPGASVKSLHTATAAAAAAPVTPELSGPAPHLFSCFSTMQLHAASWCRVPPTRCCCRCCRHRVQANSYTMLLLPLLLLAWMQQLIVALQLLTSPTAAPLL